MHVYCSYSGGVPRASSSSSSPLRTIGPAQSAEGEWLGEGGGAKGRSFVGFAEGGVLVLFSKRANERETVREKEFSMWKQSLSRRARVF